MDKTCTTLQSQCALFHAFAFLKTCRWVVFQYFIMVLLIFTLEITAGALGFLHKDEVGHRNLWIFQTWWQWTGFWHAGLLLFFFFFCFFFFFFNVGICILILLFCYCIYTSLGSSTINFVVVVANIIVSYFIVAVVFLTWQHPEQHMATPRTLLWICAVYTHHLIDWMVAWLLDWAGCLI